MGRVRESVALNLDGQGETGRVDRVGIGLEGLGGTEGSNRLDLDPVLADGRSVGSRHLMLARAGVSSTASVVRSLEPVEQRAVSDGNAAAAEEVGRSYAVEAGYKSDRSCWEEVPPY